MPLLDFYHPQLRSAVPNHAAPPLPPVTTNSSVSVSAGTAVAHVAPAQSKAAPPTTTVAAATGVPATAAASAATQPVKWTFTTEKANEKKIRDHLRVKHKTGKVGESISQHGLNKKWFVHWDNGGQTFCKESNLVQEPLEEQRRRVVRYDCYAH